jgi:membrane protein implicated in regulation of membrane protease activity
MANEQTTSNNQEVQKDVRSQFEKHIKEKSGLPGWIFWLSLAVFWLSLAAMVLGFLIIVVGAALAYYPIAPSIVVALFGALVGFFGVSFLFVYKSTINQVREYLEELQTEKDNWERARKKIQYYMHENLNQVRWIFWLTLVAMFLGFLIIVIGAALAFYSPPGQVAPSIVVTLSGVLVEFIGATFLFVYKSTMEQARGYVNILERINAVGMFIKEIDKITPSDERNKARAKIASDILSLYRLEKKQNEDAQPQKPETAVSEAPASEKKKDTT